MGQVLGRALSALGCSQPSTVTTTKNFANAPDLADDCGLMVEPKFGISGGGRSTEEMFLLLTGAQKAAKAALGDAVLDGHSIEVKRATSVTLNQVRAVKYITLVAFHEPTTSWYVMPAHEVVICVSAKSRGQHTENPFESATLSLGNLGRFKIGHESKLREAVLAAIAASAKYPQLRDEMHRVLARSKELAAESIAAVRKTARSLGLESTVAEDE
jgi:hypothetical protein